MRLTVVGCSGSGPGPAGPASCYLVQCAGYSLVIDLGQGASGVLQKHLPPAEVDALFVSHVHADHCTDMLPLAYARKYGTRPGAPALLTYGPAELEATLARTFPEVQPDWLGRRFDVRTLSEATTVLGPFVLEPRRVEHPGETYGVRVSCAHGVLAYSGDTADTAVLTEIARGADVFLCEASVSVDWPVNDPTHLSPEDAGRRARQAAVERLVLTHLPPWANPSRALSRAASEYSGPIELAASGRSFSIGRGRTRAEGDATPTVHPEERPTDG